jgi:hypothetical protein
MAPTGSIQLSVQLSDRISDGSGDRSLWHRISNLLTLLNK